MGGGQRLGGDSGLHPDVGGDSGVEDAVPDVVGEDSGGDLAVGSRAHGAGDARPAVSGNVFESEAEEAEVAQHEVGADEGLLSLPVLRIEPFGFDAGGGPAVGDGQEVAGDLLEEIDPFPRCHGGPGFLAFLESGDRLVEGGIGCFGGGAVGGDGHGRTS